MNNNYNKHKKMCEITKVGKNCKEKSRKKAVKWLQKKSAIVIIKIGTNLYLDHTKEGGG